MAQTSPEIAKEIVVAWVNQVGGTQAKSEFSGKDAQKNGEFIGKMYKAVLEAVKQGRDSLGSE